jgi:hypothetical protein
VLWLMFRQTSGLARFSYCFCHTFRETQFPLQWRTQGCDTGHPRSGVTAFR